MEVCDLAAIDLQVRGHAGVLSLHPLGLGWIITKQVLASTVLAQEAVVALQIIVRDGNHQPFEGIGQGLGRAVGVVFVHVQM